MLVFAFICSLCFWVAKNARDIRIIVTIRIQRTWSVHTCGKKSTSSAILGSISNKCLKHLSNGMVDIVWSIGSSSIRLHRSVGMLESDLNKVTTERVSRASSLPNLLSQSHRATRKLLAWLLLLQWQPSLWLLHVKTPKRFVAGVLIIPFHYTLQQHRHNTKPRKNAWGKSIIFIDRFVFVLLQVLFVLCLFRFPFISFLCYIK